MRRASDREKERERERERERETTRRVGVAGVAGSRNEICVTRGPTSPRLAPPLLSSVQLDAVPVSASRRVAARVILFNYVIPVIRARDGGTRSRGRRERQRETISPRRRGCAGEDRGGGHYEIVVTRLISTLPRELS